MQNLVVKRQKIFRDMRRKEVQSYMSKIREKLLLNQYQGVEKPSLTEQILQDYNRQMSNNHYDQQSVLLFINRIRQYRYQNYHKEELLVYLSKGLQYHLRFGQNINNLQIKNKAIQILIKIVRYIQNMRTQQLNKQTYEFMKQILQTIQNHNFQMIQVWKQMALIYHESLMHSIFQCFLRYIEQYPTDIIGILNPILQTFTNFTSLSKDQANNLLSDQLTQIIISLQIITKNITLSQVQLFLIIMILQNSYKLKSNQTIGLILQKSAIYQELLNYLETYEQKGINKTVISKLLQFIAITLTQPAYLAYQIVKNNKNLCNILMKFLPSQPVFNHIMVIEEKKTFKFTQIQKQLLSWALLCLCNIAGTTDCFDFLIEHRVLQRMLHISSIAMPFIQHQVCIFIYNCVFLARQSQLEIMLEYDLLDALCTIIKNAQQESILYCLLSLKDILVKSQNFPKSNMAWRFSKENILYICQKFNLYNDLQHYVTSNNERITNLSIQCMNLMQINQNV